MNQNRSVATIDAPEFINITPENPLISRCEIKVFYLGENRNGSYIDKNTAIQMANSLPGVPIVGAYRKDIEDFGDHGHVITIEDGEVKFSCKTIPYGFVAPDAEVWFQKFVDTDPMGNEKEREYLMTTGYLWTGQFEEAFMALEEGKGQSMELDEQTLKGSWATNNNSGVDFFIINDAIFSKLCILGDDVEPCFEGAAVTSPEVSKNFTNENEFSMTLYTMMKELEDALNIKGGSDMPELDEAVEFTETEKVEETEETAETEFNAAEEVVEEVAEEAAEDTGVDDSGVEFASKDEDEEDDDKDDSSDDDSSDDDADEEDDDEKRRPANQHSLEEFEAMQSEIETLRAELESLRNFQLEIENQKKDALIAQYHMLSDEDKKDVIEHKSEYSYEEIEQKLALIYVKNNVDFSTLTGEQEEVEETHEEDPALSFSLDEDGAEYVSPLQSALRETANRM